MCLDIALAYLADCYPNVRIKPAPRRRTNAADRLTDCWRRPYSSRICKECTGRRRVLLPEPMAGCHGFTKHVYTGWVPGLRIALDSGAYDYMGQRGQDLDGAEICPPFSKTARAPQVKGLSRVEHQLSN